MLTMSSTWIHCLDPVALGVLIKIYCLDPEQSGDAMHHQTIAKAVTIPKELNMLFINTSDH